MDGGLIMGNVRLYGSTSGYTELAPPAIAPDGVLSLPTGTGTLATAASVTAAQAAATAAGIAGGGLVAVTPSSIANSGGSASTTGNTTTFTGVTSVSLNGTFTSTYDNYVVLVTATTSNNQYPTMRLRVAGADASGSDYDAQAFEVYTSTTAASLLSNQTSWRIGYFNTEGDSAIKTEIFRPNLAATTLYQTFCDNPVQLQWDGGDHDLSTAYDGFTFISTSGTITGTIQVFGYKD